MTVFFFKVSFEEIGHFSFFSLLDVLFPPGFEYELSGYFYTYRFFESNFNVIVLLPSNQLPDVLLSVM